MALAVRRTAAAALLGLGTAVAAVAACQSNEPFGPPVSGFAGSGGGAGDNFVGGGAGGPPALDAGGLCGNQIHEVISNAPNVYFVLDASGSMGAPVNAYTRYELLRKAAVGLVKDLGPLINVGAAVFPLDASDDELCAVGGEVMPVLPGDPDGNGPITNKFRHAIDVPPFGGTPTSPTLAELFPAIATLPGQTVVILVTDGGPNCNIGAACDGDMCLPNLEGCSGASCCSAGGNCCEPGEAAGPESCLDAVATNAALADYAAAQIPVHVVGIPGSEIYEDVLSQMALAAGTASAEPPFYTAVNDMGELSEALSTIAAVAISCIFELNDPPLEAGSTNVYLDGAVVPADPQNGWRFMNPELSRIELLGDACSSLKAGKVKTVQIVTGCPTEPAK
ncbi:MAG: VWA domain-containing protein [Polyangiaceae bacterium]|nr:VWA domain-containing protein [Polyangiaceae bacterium]